MTQQTMQVRAIMAHHNRVQLTAIAATVRMRRGGIAATDSVNVTHVTASDSTASEMVA